MVLILLFLGHKFWAQNHSRSSKASKNSDFSLVSNKNLSEILPSSGLGLGPDKVGQKDLKQLHLRCHSQKNETQNQKNFFSLQTQRLAKYFKGLNSSLAEAAEELCGL